MRSLYNAVSETLDRVDFSLLFPGFHRFPFALYNNAAVTLRDIEIPYDRRFLGNTAIEYEGGFLAIWMVEDAAREDPVSLAVNLVHEMFHAFQYERGEIRFPNDLIGLDYPRTAEVLIAKSLEYALLREVFAEKDVGQKRELLIRFMAYRLHRQSWMGEIIRQEYLVETGEGMAEYTLLKALKSLSEELYQKQIESHLSNLKPDCKSAFDMRRLAYWSGSLFLVAALEAGFSFAHEIGKETRCVFELLSVYVKAQTPPPPEEDTLLAAQTLTEANEDALSARFLAFERQKTTCTEGSFTIYGYDPMNMVKKDTEVLCTHFVMLKPVDGESVFIKDPVLLHMEKGTYFKVRAYETAE